MSGHPVRATRTRIRRPNRSIVRSAIESLEGRRLLAAVSWDGGAGTLEWTDAANWSNNVLPGANDDVTINIAGTPTVTISSGDQQIKSLNSSETVRINAAGLSVANTSTTTGLTLAGGTLSGAGQLTTQTLTWTAGLMSGTGTTQVIGTSSIVIPETDSLYLAESRRLLIAGGTTTVSRAAGGDPVYAVNFYDSARLQIGVGGTLSLVGDASLAAITGTPDLINGGTLTKTGSVSNANVAIGGTGTYNVTSGTLALGGGGALTGTANVSNGAALEFSGGALAVSAFTANGLGTTRITGGEVDFNGTTSINTAFRMSAGTLSGTGTVTLNAAWTIEGGLLTGSGTLRSTGTGNLIIPAADPLYLAESRRLLIQSGTTSVQRAADGDPVYAIYGYDTAVIEVASAGTLSFTNSSFLNAITGTPQLINNGTVRSAQLATERSTIYFSLAGNGVYDLVTGSLHFGGGGSIGGSVIFGVGTYFTIDAGTLTLTNFGSTGSADRGVVHVDGGIAQFNGTCNINSDLWLESGTLAGSGIVSVGGKFRWTGGLMTGSGMTRANSSGGEIIIPAAEPLQIAESRRLVIAGATTLSRAAGGDPAIGVYGYDNATIEVASGGTLTLAGDAYLVAITGTPQLLNNGTIAKNTAGVASSNYLMGGVGGTFDLTNGVIQLLGGGTFAGSASIGANASLDIGQGQGLTLGALTTSGAGSLVISGLATFNGAASIGSTLSVISGGTLAGSGTVTVGGKFDWSGGVLSGSGTLRANGNASTLVIPAAELLQIAETRRLLIGGTTTISRVTGGDTGTVVAGYDNAVIEVASGGTLTLAGIANLAPITGTPQLTVDSGGILRKTLATTANVTFNFENHGLVDVTAGRLNFNSEANLGTGTFLSAGGYRVATGTTLDFRDPITTLAADIEIAGTGSVPDLATLTTNRGRIALTGGKSLTVTPELTGGVRWFNQEGIIDLGPGSTLTIAGNFRVAGTSQPIVRSEIASATSFGKLAINSSANFNAPNTTSRFDPDLVGGYDPAPGTKIAVITFNGDPGDNFDAFFGGSTPSGNTLTLVRETFKVNVGVSTGPAPAAPQLVSQSFESLTREAIIFQFNQDVSAFLARKDYRIRNVTTNQTIDANLGTLTFNQASNQATLVLTNLLPNGNYELTVQASDIANSAGVPLTAGTTFKFFVLHGDSDRDRDVDFNDLLALARNYGTTGKNSSQGNFNYDAAGSVDFDDLLMLARAYGVVLPVVAPTAAAITPTTRKQAAADVL